MSRIHLVLVVAHDLEAAPLVRQFKLKSVCKSPFKFYRNTDGLALVVSGMGRMASALAVAYAAARLEAEAQTEGDEGAQKTDYDRLSAPGFLNLGIAGHGDVEACRIGDVFWINRVTELCSGACYYPTPIFTQCGSTALITVDKPELEYAEPVAYDMEASGFWRAASKFAMLDFIQCLKLVSDSPERHVSRFKVTDVAELMAMNAELLQAAVGHLKSLCREQIERHALPANCAQALSSLHFTTTQRHQLRHLWRRCETLGLIESAETVLRESRSAKQLISGLGRVLERVG